MARCLRRRDIDEYRLGDDEELATVPFSSAEDVDEAIEWMNESHFENSASLFTGSGTDARKFLHVVDIVNLGVNVGTASPLAFFHFGDLRTQGEDMIHIYTDKTVYIERWPDA